LFRLFAVLLGLSPLLLLEVVFALLGWGVTTEADDPYIGFSEIRPLFVRRGDRYEIPQSRQTYFRPQSFPAEKGPRTSRIFCLGGSTVQGRPYAVETAFSTWLALNLQAADPSRDWEVINCGGVSYASYRLAPIVKEVLQHEPDLLILYTGHNEFLEDRTYEDVKSTPAPITGAHALLSHSRTYNVLRSAWQGSRTAAPANKTEMAAEVDALLDYQGGLESYHRDDAWRRGVVKHFEFNLRRMIALARQAGVPVLLADPVSNLKDSPPFKFQNSDDLSEEEKAKFDALWRQAQDLTGEELQRQYNLLQQALAIDDRHAGAQYHLGKCCEAMGRYDEAKQHFLRAQDEDICPLRAISPLHEAILRVSDDTGTPLVDVRGLFQRESPHGIPGDELMVDHVHPDIHGHQLIADLLLEAMAKQQLVTPRDNWRDLRKPLFVAQMQSLDDVYFQRGKQRLEGLRRWSQGRALKIRPQPLLKD
jgi:lysophospholipase L1-like esterase